jgi:hypothetical protein
MRSKHTWQSVLSYQLVYKPLAESWLAASEDLTLSFSSCASWSSCFVLCLVPRGAVGRVPIEAAGRLPMEAASRFPIPSPLRCATGMAFVFFLLLLPSSPSMGAFGVDPIHPMSSRCRSLVGYQRLNSTKIVLRFCSFFRKTRAWRRPAPRPGRGGGGGGLCPTHHTPPHPGPPPPPAPPPPRQVPIPPQPAPLPPSKPGRVEHGGEERLSEPLALPFTISVDTTSYRPSWR